MSLGSSRLYTMSREVSHSLLVATFKYSELTSDVAGELSRPLTSFAFVPGSGGPQLFVTINKDGNVEFSETKESPQAAFAVKSICSAIKSKSEGFIYRHPAYWPFLGRTASPYKGRIWTPAFRTERNLLQKVDPMLTLTESMQSAGECAISKSTILHPVKPLRTIMGATATDVLIGVERITASTLTHSLMRMPIMLFRHFSAIYRSQCGD